MSIYDVAEQSVHDAAPIEAYKFIGTFEVYRYTSADLPVEVYGETYNPAAISRKAVKVATHTEGRLDLEIEMPIDLPLVQAYAFATSPPKLELEVYRVHRGTDFSLGTSLLWKGEVTAFSVTGTLAKLLVPSVFSRLLEGTVPNVYYQTVCNHVLYDARCKVATAGFSATSTVVDVDSESVEVANDGAADAALKAGEIVCPRTGERRLILDNQANLLTINFPFVDLVNGDTVVMYQGCDHLLSTCTSKFSNATNFGGHPYIPTDNPFTVTTLQ